MFQKLDKYKSQLIYPSMTNDNLTCRKNQCGFLMFSFFDVIELLHGLRCVRNTNLILKGEV